MTDFNRMFCDSVGDKFKMQILKERTLGIAPKYRSKRRSGEHITTDEFVRQSKAFDESPLRWLQQSGFVPISVQKFDASRLLEAR